MIIISFAFSEILRAGDDLSNKLDEMEIAAENRYLKLFINKNTTEIGIRDKVSDNLWFSNPFKDPDRDEFKSQFRITYDPNRKTKNNYKYSTVYDQFDITQIDGGVRIDYQIIEETKAEDYVSHVMEKQYWEETILGEQDYEEQDIETILDNYLLVELKEISEEERIEIRGLNQEELLGDYAVFPRTEKFRKDEKRYNRLKEELNVLEENQNSKENEESEAEREELKDKIEEIERSMSRARRDATWLLVRYTVLHNHGEIDSVEELSEELFVPFKDSIFYLLKDGIPPFVMDDIAAQLQGLEVTPEMTELQHVRFHLDPPTEQLEVFEVSVEYLIDDQDFIVLVPGDKIKYPQSVRDRGGQLHTYPILDLDLFPFFGSAARNQEGYMLVPDGSGGLINFEESKSRAPDFNQRIYGDDKTTVPPEDVSLRDRIFRKNISFPVFGLKQADRAFLGIIEEGESLARIRARKADDHTPYHSIYPSFTVVDKGEIELAEDVGYTGELEAAAELYAEERYEGNFKIRYSFLGGEEANYTGMAHRFQEHLVNNKDLDRKETKGDIPFFLELIGGVTQVQPVMGYPREVMQPLTTYEEVREIIRKFRDRGIDNIILKYKGWMQGGIDHDYPDKVRLSDSLGGIEEFEKLISFVEENDVSFYPEISFLNIYDDSLFRFNHRRHASRRLDRRTARNEKKDSYLLSPGFVEELINNFAKDYKKYGIDNLFLRDFGSELNSDFSRDNPIDREKAKQLHTEKLESLTGERKLNLMFNEGYSYGLRFADYILNVPLQSSGHSIIDECVPFMQIVLQGYVNYSGSPINYAIGEEFKSTEDYQLKLIETGSQPYYQGIFRENETIRDTEYDHFIRLNFNDWLTEAVNYYEKFNDLFKGLQNQRIIDHQNLKTDVYKTVYENGTSIITNYNQETIQIEGNEVEGKSYKVLEGGF